jgi:hypothetical protein
MSEYTAVQTIMWNVWNERERQYVHTTLHQGVTGEVPDDVVARLERLTEEDGTPRILSPEDYEAWTSATVTAASPVNALSDAQINAMDAQALVGQLNQNPAMAARVLELENSRDKPRKPIISLSERIIAAQQGEDVSLANEDSSTKLTPAES